MYSLTPLTGPLGKQNAGHLLRRATYGPTQKDIKEIALLTAEEAVNMLFETQDEPDAPIDPLTGENWVSPKPGEDNSDEEELRKYFAAWHLELMRKEPLNIREKITFFFHTHLPVAYSKVSLSTPVYYQNKLYRHFAFGSFKTMFRKLVIDNAMLWYLDNTFNYVDEPNENFAREMLELYTIGKGPQIGQGDYTNYTEDDIKEAARVLTGYIFDEEFTTYDQDLLPETQIATGYVYTYDENLAVLHDPGVKTFSEKFQNQQIQPDEIISGFATKEATLTELDEMIDMIFSQEETAKFLVRKIYRYFVYYKISDEVEEEIIVPLAETFRDNDYSMVAVLKQLLKSKHFYDADNSETTDDSIGALIKSPLDLFMGALKFFKLDFPSEPDKLYRELYGNVLLSYFYIMGMPLYNPEDVAGYPAYFQGPGYNRNWMTPTNLAYRYYPVYALILGIKNDDGEALLEFDIVGWLDHPDNISDPSNTKEMVREFTDGLFSKSLPEERLDYFIDNIFMDGLPSSYWTTEWVKYKDGGVDTTVRALLHRLMIGLMQSPEFQLF